MFLCTGETVVNASAYEGEAWALRCKRWSCPHCRLINRKKVMHAARKGKPSTFMTLTINSNDHDSPDEAARELKRGWCALRRRIQRAWPGHKIPFIVVFEKHKSGYPHMHLLLRAPFIPQKWLKAAWEQITGAWMVHISQIRTVGQAMFYVTKYIGKDLAPFEGCKRWWRSHDYNVIEEEREPIHLYGSGIARMDVPFDLLRTNAAILIGNIESLAPDRIRWRSMSPLPYGQLATFAFRERVEK